MRIQFWKGISLVALVAIGPSQFLRASSAYEMEGIMVRRGFDGHGVPDSEPLAARFRVSVDGSSWRSWVKFDGAPKHDMAGSTNANEVYVVSVFPYPDTELKKLSESDPHDVRISTIQNAPHPIGQSAGFMPHIFLMFASQTYLDSLDKKELIPFWNRDVEPHMDAERRIAARWRKLGANPRFCENIEMFDDGDLKWWSLKEKKRQTHSGNPPYDKGYLAAKCELLGTTNVSGSVFPSSYRFRRYAPQILGQSTNDLVIVEELVAEVSSVRVATDEKKFIPAIHRVSSVEDERFRNVAEVGQAVSYMATNGQWLSSNQVLELRGMGPLVGETERRRKIGRLIFVILALLPGVLIAWVWTRRRQRP